MRVVHLQVCTKMFAMRRPRLLVARVFFRCMIFYFELASAISSLCYARVFTDLSFVSLIIPATIESPTFSNSIHAPALLSFPRYSTFIRSLPRSATEKNVEVLNVQSIPAIHAIADGSLSIG